MLRKIFLLLLLPFLAYGASVQLEFDNDVILASDEKYTGGLNIIFMGDKYQEGEEGYYNDYVSFLNSLYGWIPKCDLERKDRYGSFSIQQITITPEDINASAPVYNDTPYAGSLQIHFSLFATNDESFEEYRFTIGTVGKYAFSEEVQNGIHNVLGNTKARGWQHQLGDHYGVGLGYIHGARIYETKMPEDHNFEWFYGYFADLGTAYIGGGASTLVRIGKNMPRNIDVPNSLFNHAPNKILNLYKRSKEFGYSMEMGTSFNAIGYNYLYSEARKQGYAIKDNKLVMTSKLGFNLYFENMNLAFEFYPVFTRDEDPQSTSWGRLSFGWSY